MIIRELWRCWCILSLLGRTVKKVALCSFFLRVEKNSIFYMKREIRVLSERILLRAVFGILNVIEI